MRITSLPVSDLRVGDRIVVRSEFGRDQGKVIDGTVVKVTEVIPNGNGWVVRLLREANYLGYTYAFGKDYGPNAWVEVYWTPGMSERRAS